MRDHAQGAVRSLSRQALVHVYGLYQSETRHYQYDNQRRPFLEQRVLELALSAHTETLNTVYRTLTRGANPRQPKIAGF